MASYEERSGRSNFITSERMRRPKISIVSSAGTLMEMVSASPQAERSRKTISKHLSRSSGLVLQQLRSIATSRR